MKKFGFTLAEVLITLGIIGVVAALTAPALVLSSRNEANAAKLSVVVSNLENAFTTMIAKENTSNLYGTKAWGVVQGADWADNGNANDLNNRRQLNATSSDDDIAGFVGWLGQYMHVNGYKRQNASTYYNGSGPYALTNEGGAGNIVEGSPGFALELKNGATIFMRVFANGDGNTRRTQEEISDVIQQGGSLMSDAADILIDVNGKNPPNTLGRDLFGGYLGSNGIFYPSGGMDVSIYDRGGRDNTWNNINSGWACLPDQNKVANEGHGCTARIISEGYKMNY